MARRSSALEVFAYTNLAVAAALVASPLVFAMPTSAAVALFAAGLVVGILGGYNAFLAHQDLPHSRKSAGIMLLAGLGVLLVPALAPLSVAAMTVVLVSGMLVFAMSGAELTGVVETRSLPQAHDRGPP